MRCFLSDEIVNRHINACTLSCSINATLKNIKVKSIDRVVINIIVAYNGTLFFSFLKEIIKNYIVKIVSAEKSGEDVVLNIGDLQPEEIGVELLFAVSDNKGRLHIQERCDFDVVECNDGIAKFQATILPERTGMYQVAGRIYAKNSKLPHRQDFELVRWL